MQQFEVTITITGAPASGKSAIAQCIAAFLRNQDVRVVNNDPDVVRPRTMESLAIAFQGISRKTKVIINVVPATKILEGEIIEPGYPPLLDDKL